MSISETVGQIAIKFCLKLYKGFGKAAINFADSNFGFHGNRYLPWGYNEENFSCSSAFSFDQIFLILAGNENNHKVLNEFEIRPDPITTVQLAAFEPLKIPI